LITRFRLNNLPSTQTRIESYKRKKDWKRKIKLNNKGEHYKMKP
jgi:hypothetical protein